MLLLLKEDVRRQFIERDSQTLIRHAILSAASSFLRTERKTKKRKVQEKLKKLSLMHEDTHARACVRACAREQPFPPPLREAVIYRPQSAKKNPRIFTHSMP